MSAILLTLLRAGRRNQGHREASLDPAARIEHRREQRAFAAGPGQREGLEQLFDAQVNCICQRHRQVSRMLVHWAPAASRIACHCLGDGVGLATATRALRSFIARGLLLLLSLQRRTPTLPSLAHLRQIPDDLFVDAIELDLCLVDKLAGIGAQFALRGICGIGEERRYRSLDLAEVLTDVLDAGIDASIVLLEHLPQSQCPA
mmetsp:Transcript_42856/g.96601  ORF Transcript_42856/g.96601 Transcript_42856/m.96601 type:complete len:203 (-) Transcript_42856:321-929(-)